ncbi:Chromosomal replication initiator protein DnaA [hydrothermal vent metagenome]|uniref:Chromosomal replication initiator protein DnaA n=1 Tax=hydrothermal vent metagenome TaxID=652676 RepID=A0A3B1CU75_9ZZZZ
MTSKEILWQQCLKEIEAQILPENYTTLFSPTYACELGNDSLTVAVPSIFFKKCLEENYQDLIETTLESLLKKKTLVDFYVTAEPEQKNSLQTTNGNSAKIKYNPEADLKSRMVRAALNPKYTFSSYVVGSSNQFAHAAANAVASNPAGAYNPLFIYGSVGLGKTHLMHAIGHKIIENDPEARVRYISAESFTVDLIESLKRDEMPRFRQRYRPLDVLLIDDIQFLAGKDRTQEEFFYTFNTLYESHKQIIISGDRYPKDLQNIEERLRSRFESGLVADINSPDVETKVAILFKKAEFHKKTIPHDVALFIASNIKSNIRELEGLLLRIIAYASFTYKNISLELAKEVLKEFTHDKTKNFTIPNIQRLVASYFTIKVSDLKSKTRSRHISFPRQIAMYICREHTKSSLPDIGKQFGGKDHTTVIFSHKKITKLVNENNPIAMNIEEILERIEGE